MKRMFVTMMSLCVIMASCTGGGPRNAQPTDVPTTSPQDTKVQPTKEPTVRFKGSFGLTFRHRVSWREHHYRYVSHFVTPIVYLSNGPLHPPCVIHKHRNGTSSVCGQPIDELRPRQVLVWWWEGGSPSFSIAAQAGRRVVVGGLHGKLERFRKPGRLCTGADLALLVFLGLPRSPTSWIGMGACARQPHLRATDSELRALLRSVHFDHA